MFVFQFFSHVLGFHSYIIIIILLWTYSLHHQERAQRMPVDGFAVRLKKKYMKTKRHNINSDFVDYCKLETYVPTFHSQQRQ